MMDRFYLEVASNLKIHQLIEACEKNNIHVVSIIKKTKQSVE